MSTTKPPAGTRDFLPDEIRRREHVINIVRSVYERYGFEPLETPAFENIETLLGKYGDEGNKLIFKILRRGEHEASGEADLALRYDLTVPLARVIAQYQNELPKFFKRYQIQPVWRADRPARGRFREFYQCDIDSIGSTSAVVEVEQLSAVSDVLTELGFKDFQLRINHRGVLDAMLERAGIEPAERANALVIIDKQDKIGRQGVFDQLQAKYGNKAAAECMSPIHATSLADSLLAVTGLPAGSPKENLELILNLASSTAAATFLRLDTSLARGLSYYTGAIMEVNVEGIGSLGGGGRYNNLIGTFLGRGIPACGFSLGLERIIVIMTERNMFPSEVVRGAVDVMVTLWNEETRADALALAAELRRADLRVDVYPEAEKLGKQFKYAATRAVPFVVVVGVDERAADNVSIKNLASSDQQTVPRAEAAGWIKRHLNEEPGSRQVEP